jgi:hypothetical protein
LPQLIDITGQTFGFLRVIEKAENAIRGKSDVKWLCVCVCGNKTIVTSQSIRAGKTVSCGCYWRARMCGPNSPRWSTRRRKTNSGYIILANAEYPGAAFPNHTKEHIVVMSRHLGRKLLKGETVHHKNGLRDDNRIENLELRASAHGKGQSVVDLLSWAKEIFLRYSTKDWHL